MDVTNLIILGVTLPEAYSAPAEPKVPGNLGEGQGRRKADWAEQWAPASGCEFTPSAKKPALHQRSLIPVGVICLVLSNQQITSNQSAVGLFMLRVSKLAIPARWVPRHPGLPQPPHLNTKDERKNTPHWDTGLICTNTSLLHYALSVMSITNYTPASHAGTAYHMYTKNCQNAWTKSQRQVKELRTSTVGPAHGLTIWGWGGSIESSVPPSRPFLTLPPSVHVPSLNTLRLISASVAAISCAFSTT